MYCLVWKEDMRMIKSSHAVCLLLLGVASGIVFVVYYGGLLFYFAA